MEKNASFSFSSQFLSFFNANTHSWFICNFEYVLHEIRHFGTRPMALSSASMKVGLVRFNNLFFFTWPNLKGIANRQYHKVVQSFGSLPVANVCSFSILLCNLVTHRLAIKKERRISNLPDWFIWFSCAWFSTPTGRNQLETTRTGEEKTNDCFFFVVIRSEWTICWAVQLWVRKKVEKKNLDEGSGKKND